MHKRADQALRLDRPFPWTKVALGSLGSWLLTTALTTIPALGAERISLVYGPLQFSLPIEALEIYAREGRVTNELAFFARRASPKQLAALRNLLQRRLAVSPTTVAQFTYSRIGETTLKRLGQIFQTESGQNSFFALRAALILAAADSEGLSGLNLLRQFPTRSIQIDLNQGLQTIREIEKSFQIREAMIAGIQRQAAAEAAMGPLIDFSKQLDLQDSGPFSWRKERVTFDDRRRQRVFPADIYLPQLSNPRAAQQPAPMIVISHGAASDRNTFAYLAQHLASYGFAVAVPEHADNAQRFRQFYAGLARPPEPTELIDRPLDVKYLLDELQRLEQSDPVWQGRLNLQQVGVIGQSMGGYTALVLAGAKLTSEQPHWECSRTEPHRTLLNSSLLVQCDAIRLSASTDNLQDKRVKAIIAINPLSSSILGQRSLSQIQVPLMLVAASADTFTPAVPEQIIPFTWLTTPNRYLVLVEKGSHFSMLKLPNKGGGGLPRLPATLIGPKPALARRYLKALSVAFAQTHVANQPEYRRYLGATYAKAISQAPLDLSLVQSLTAAQLDQALDQVSKSSQTVSKLRRTQEDLPK